VTAASVIASIALTAVGSVDLSASGLVVGVEGVGVMVVTRGFNSPIDVSVTLASTMPTNGVVAASRYRMRTPL